MPTQDFGPVPVSRLKEEAQRLYHALESGHRVLVSRHGRVVAAITPPSLSRDNRLLAAFALHGSSVSELSATDIGQGSPSEAVRRAEDGEPIVVTRQNRVVGVLGTAPIAQETVESAEAQERMLAAFEAANPDATPEEFAEASMRISTRFAGPPADAAASQELSTAATAVIVDAFLVEGRAHEASKDLPAAATALLSGLRYREHPDFRVRSKVAETMVELAKVYTHEGRTAEAVDLTEDAVDLLEPYVSPTTGTGPSSPRGTGEAKDDGLAAAVATRSEREAT